MGTEDGEEMKGKGGIVLIKCACVFLDWEGFFLVNLELMLGKGDVQIA